jgi:hypothetical protein
MAGNLSLSVCSIAKGDAKFLADNAGINLLIISEFDSSLEPPEKLLKALAEIN